MNTNTERIYSLQQAVTVTGFSAGKFRYNKPALLKAGVTITSAGWRIPHSTLLKMGWLGVKPPKGDTPEMSALEAAELRVKQLEAEVERLTAELANRPTKRRGLFGR